MELSTQFLKADVQAIHKANNTALKTHVTAATVAVDHEI